MLHNKPLKLVMTAKCCFPENDEEIERDVKKTPASSEPATASISVVKAALAFADSCSARSSTLSVSFLLSLSEALVLASPAASSA